MPKFYEVTRVGQTDGPDGKPIKTVTRAFGGTNRGAKMIGRDWSGTKRLPKDITIKLIEIEKGKDNMLAFINRLVGFNYDPSKYGKKKRKKDKGMKAHTSAKKLSKKKS